jgi:PAS domain-containing protein
LYGGEKFMFQPKIKGERFVFYSALAQSNFNSHNKIYEKAKNYFNKPFDKKRDNYETIYSQALRILKKNIENEYKKEISFLKYLSIKEDFPLKSEVNNILNGKDKNFKNLIILLNKHYLGAENFEKKIQIEAKRLRKEEEFFEEFNLKNLRDSTGKSLYTLIYGEEGLEGLDPKKQRFFSKLMGQNPNLKLSELIREEGLLKFLEEQIIEYLKENSSDLLDDKGDISDRVIKIIDYLIIEKLDNIFYYTKSGQIRQKNIISYTNNIIKNIDKDRKALEQIKESIQQILAGLNEKKSFLEQIADGIFLTDEEKKSRKNKLQTEIDNLQIEINKIQTQIHEIVEQTEEEEKKKKKLQEDLEDKQRQLKNKEKTKSNFEKNPLIIKNSGKMWFESEIRTAILPYLYHGLSYLGTGQNKDDTISIYLQYQLPKIDGEPINMTMNLMDFNDTLKEISRDPKMETDKLMDRSKVILNKIKEINEKERDIIDQVPKKEELRDYFNSFIIHGTNKSYSIFDNLEGFSAGVLGSSKGTGWSRGSSDIVSGISNICYMAEQGGITKLDQEWLIHAAINCANGLIGEELKLKDPLQNLLSSIAGALMFDDAALIMAEINEKINSELKTSFKQLHLYNLNGFYFPLSYILQETYDGLSKVKQETERVSNRGNQIHIINKYKTKENLPFTEEAWRQESQEAIDQTAIKMTFMAGFLDVLESFFPQTK